MDRDAWVTPDKPAVARLDVVLNQDVEAMHLTVLDPSFHDRVSERRALERVIRTATFCIPRDVERSPGSLRAWAGPRPHARLRITHYVREDGTVDGEQVWLGDGPEDVLPGEHERLTDRALALTAAAVLERLAQLEGGV